MGSADRNHPGTAASRRAFILSAALTLTGCQNPPENRTDRPENATAGAGAPAGLPPAPLPPEPLPSPPGKEQIVATFTGQAPLAWGLQLPGVLTHLPPGNAGIALSFDCCGGPGGNAVDQNLIDALQKTGTPATFFLNLRWIRANPGPAKSLAENPLFEIGNHGTRHVPLSVSGRSAYGIPGTASVAEIYDEVMTNQDAIHGLTGRAARYFRSGTAYLDDVAVRIVHAMGMVPVSFSTNGDGGATYPAAVVFREITAARAGEIVIAHANHPTGGTAAGIVRALPALRAAGVIPVPLTDT
ncbi:peptidoglycan/xylan/chitin deacetylase (PgdA/CDA1 family) [Arthrobacter sp. UYCo732]